MLNDIIFENIAGVDFIKRPMPVPYTYRISYKVSQIILILGLCSSKGKCSLIKIHLLSWALSSDKDQENLIRFLDNSLHSTYPYVRFDPSLNRALSFGIAEKAIELQSSGKYALTKQGENVLKDIMDDKEVMNEEKNFLKFIGNKLPETKINRLFIDRRIYK